MHVRLRLFGKPETIMVVESKLTKIDHFRLLIRDKFDVDPKIQRLIYGGKEVMYFIRFLPYICILYLYTIIISGLLMNKLKHSE